MCLDKESIRSYGQPVSTGLQIMPLCQKYGTSTHILCCPAGASGGAVVNASGHLIGLMTSNARHSRTSTTIPTLNFSIPAALLQPLVALLEGENIVQSALDELDVTNEALQQMWGHPADPSLR